MSKRKEPSDGTGFAVDRKTYDELRERFDAPPKPNARLRRTLETPAPWEEDRVSGKRRD